ncbi:MAG: helix-turn-helix domain-containing protein, partial [bacterium]
MIRVILSYEEKMKLIKLREGSISEHSEKALMVLLSNEGKSPQEIGKLLQRNPHTVRDWLKRYKNEG